MTSFLFERKIRIFDYPKFAEPFRNTASADFSTALTAEISPGKVQNLSSRAAWLYLMRLW
jgi:hypothetical protein